MMELNCQDISAAPFTSCVLTTKRYYKKRKRELATIPIMFAYRDYKIKQIPSPLDKYQYPKTFLNTIKS